MNYRRLFLAVFAFALFLLTAACGDDPKARLRVVHASPDAPNVDVTVDGASVATNVAYQSASKYLEVKAGQRKVEVLPTGSSTPAINTTVNLASKSDYTALAIGKVANIELLAATDDNTPPASGQIKLRVIHASPSAGNVDVYVTPPGADLTAATPTLTNVAFKAVSDYLSVPAGSYEVRVTPTGTKTVAIDSGTLTLSAGQIRTAVALDATGGGAPFTAIVLADLN